MKVNRNSWHYKLMDHFDHNVISRLDYNQSVTLCQYFWSLIGALFQSIGVVLLGIGCTLMLSVIVFAVIVAPINYLLTAYFGVVDITDGCGGMLLVLFWIVIPLFAGIEEYMRGNIKGVPDWMRFSHKEVVKKEKKPNLAWEYIKAKKRKVCPLIQLEK